MRGIGKQFGAATALHGVDFDVRAGEVHAILGENGAGKSTLMHILTGAVRPDAGEILLDGAPARIDSPAAARRRGIAMVHQHFTLVPAFTVTENLALGGSEPAEAVRRTGWSARRAAEPALERARSLGWDLPPDARIAELAVGTQQRIEIAKALATGAPVLIFDEPTAVLAEHEVEDLFDVLRRARTEGRAIVLIAHKLAEVLSIADRVTVLRLGARVVTAERAEVDAPALAAWMMGAQPAEAPREQPAALASETAEPPRAGSAGTAASAASDRAAPSAAKAEQAGHRVALTVAELAVRGDRGEIAVRGVSFTVGQGEIFGVGGVDGNGQAELAEALVGLRPIESGEASWDGGRFVPGVRPITGYIPQDRRRSGLAVGMTVEENLIFGAILERRFRRGPLLRRRALRETAAELVERFDIRVPSLAAPVSTLSGGNQQKIVVARSLRASPAWIVAVNPTRGLDIGATRFVWDQLRGARAAGAAILLISTDLDELAALADRAAILSGGNLTEASLDRARLTDIGLLLGGAGADRAARTERSNTAGPRAARDPAASGGEGALPDGRSRRSAPAANPDAGPKP